MKGIILAGGSGTRLYPITKGISKQLMPIYDKPMIYYPLCTLMEAGINEILVITTPHEQEQFMRLLGDGSQWGIDLKYKVQPTPGGLAQAYTIGEEFIGNDKVAMVLGDNIFHGSALGKSLARHTDVDGGTVFAYQVSDPERYGIVEFDDNMKAISVEEKPLQPKSNYALVGLYFFDNEAVEIAKNAQPSARGEIEITSVMDVYLKKDKLNVEVLDRGSAWLDTGTFASMMDASNFVQIMEDRTSLKIGCVEEVAWRQGYISNDQLAVLSDPLKKSGYGEYLLRLLDRAS
jgi:glucose-1-phosphate thymidylyltransferase